MTTDESHRPVGLRKSLMGIIPNLFVVIIGAIALYVVYLAVAWNYTFAPNNSDYVRSFLGTAATVSATMSGLLIATLAFLFNKRPKLTLTSIFARKNLDILMLGGAVMSFLLQCFYSLTSLAEMTNTAGPVDLARIMNSSMETMRLGFFLLIMAIWYGVMIRATDPIFRSFGIDTD